MGSVVATFSLLASFTMEGKWQADQLKLEVAAEGEGVWHLCAHVANTMNCKVTKAGDSYSAGMVSSTRMLPPPDLQEKERGEQPVGKSQLHFSRRWSAENRFGLFRPSSGSCTRLRRRSFRSCNFSQRL